ncbi:FAD-binding domain-containing protein 47 [Elsinoe fawcettii]|nr:FAD-binding domain-containing protein 47 [Elsinoe fawcettii]
MRRDSVTPHSPLRIAIIGGGIGGLYTSLSLSHHLGALASITVYERASEFKEIGAGVGLGINAARLIHAVGLGDGLNRVGGNRNGVWISFRRYDNSEDIVTIRVDDKGHVRQCPVARSDLLDLFKGAVEERGAARLVTGKKFVRVEDAGEDGVKVWFADGSVEEADVVVGADGIHSSVRAQFTRDDPIYSGRVAYRATVPIGEIEGWWPFDTYSVMWNGKRRHFLVFPISANKTLNIVAFANTNAEDARDVAESWVSTCQRKEIEEAYQGFDENVQRLIRLMPEEPSRWKINDRAPLGKWHYMDGKVVLLGDAAHASEYLSVFGWNGADGTVLPHMGAGAGQAIEDGWILGRALGEMVNGTDKARLNDLESCAAFYQKVRLPRAQKVQEKSRDTGATYDLYTKEMQDKSYEDSLPMLAEKMHTQMKFVWEAELDQIYNDAKGKIPKQSLTDSALDLQSTTKV